MDASDIDPLVFCAHCGEEISCFASFEDFSLILREEIVPGNRYLCGLCAGLSVVDEKLDLRKATERDIVGMSADSRREMAELIRAIRAAKREGRLVDVGELLREMREEDD